MRRARKNQPPRPPRRTKAVLLERPLAEWIEEEAKDAGWSESRAIATMLSDFAKAVGFRPNGRARRQS
jgi:hypothetical protein